MASVCMTLQSTMIVCAPAAAAVVEPTRCLLLSSSPAAGYSKWGLRVSSKATFMRSLLHKKRTASRVVRTLAVAQLSDFAAQEAAKFREGLLKQLEATTTSSDNDRSVDVCAKIFGDYVDKYDGSLSPEPFGTMKEALDSQNLPDSESVICAALGWTRVNLHYDWKISQEKK